MAKPQPTPLRPETYSDFPKPKSPSLQPSESLINERIDRLRKATREEVETAIENITDTNHHRNRAPLTLRCFLPNQRSNRPDESLQLSPGILIDKMRQQRMLAPGADHTQSLKTHKKTAHTLLGPYELLIATLPKPGAHSQRYQIETSKVEIVDHLTPEIQVAHQAANTAIQNSQEETHKEILKFLTKQFWGFEIDESHLSAIEEINQSAKKQELSFRIAVRNGIAIITQEDNIISVPCLEPSRNQLPSNTDAPAPPPPELTIQEPIPIPIPLGMEMPIPIDTPVEDLTLDQKQYLLARLQCITPEETREVLSAKKQEGKQRTIGFTMLHFMQNSQRILLSTLKKIYEQTNGKAKSARSSTNGSIQSLTNGRYALINFPNLTNRKDPWIGIQETHLFKETHFLPPKLMQKHEEAKTFTSPELNEPATTLLHTLAHKYFGILLPETEETKSLIEKINKALKQPLGLKIHYRNGIAILNFTEQNLWKSNLKIPNPATEITTPTKKTLPRLATAEELRKTLKQIPTQHKTVRTWIRHAINLELGKWRYKTPYTQGRDFQKISEALASTQIRPLINEDTRELEFIFIPTLPTPPLPETPDTPPSPKTDKLKKRLEDLENANLKLLEIIKGLKTAVDGYKDKLANEIETTPPLKILDIEILYEIVKTRIQEILETTTPTKIKIGSLRTLLESLEILHHTDMDHETRQALTRITENLRVMTNNRHDAENLTRRQIQRLTELATYQESLDKIKPHLTTG